jgi:acyl-CoA synthetase (NDP forming)
MNAAGAWTKETFEIAGSRLKALRGGKALAGPPLPDGGLAGEKPMKPAEQTRAALTVDEFHAAAERNKQWGRWGLDDEIGTLNNVTPAVKARGDLAKAAGELGYPLAMKIQSPDILHQTEVGGWR